MSWHLNEALKDTKVVCLSAGTAAVHLALLASGVGLGDEVCVQSYTFCASSHPITYLGAKPVLTFGRACYRSEVLMRASRFSRLLAAFVGSEDETWNMDPALLEKAIDLPQREGCQRDYVVCHAGARCVSLL